MTRTEHIIARFPHFYQSEDWESLFYKYISVFAGELDLTEEAELNIQRSHWIKTADNSPDKDGKGDLDKILALYLESLGGTALLTQGTRRQDTEGGKEDDDLYRNRVMSVIQVLKNGASTKQGIIDIIAANLGISQDMPYQDEARKKIKIVEYLPEIVSTTYNQSNKQTVQLFKPFTVNNNSTIETIPEFRLFLNDTTNTAKDDIAIPSLFDLKIINTQTGEFVQYEGEIKAGDTLIFLSDGTGLLRGSKFETNGRMLLPPGESVLQIEADWGVLENGKYVKRPIGRFNQTRFNNAVFVAIGNFAQLNTSYLKLTPATFAAVVPWDIAGFSTTITITQHTLDRLKILNVSETHLAALSSLKDKTFDTIDAFYSAYTAVLPDMPLDTEGGQYLKELILSEAELADKFERFNINPRTQIMAIINRVKAAGVYAEMIFEKRFNEHQELAETFRMSGERAILSEDHQMKEDRFNIISEQQIKETHEAKEELLLSGVFDFTRFDSLNGFT